VQARARWREEKERRERERRRRAMSVPQILLRLASLYEKVGRATMAEGMFEEAVMMLKDINGVLHKSVADALCQWAACIAAQSAAVYDVVDTDPGERYHEAVRVLNEAGNIYTSLRAGTSAATPAAEKDAVAAAETRSNKYDRGKALDVVHCLTQLADLHRTHRQYHLAKDAYEAIMSVFREVKVGLCDDLAGAQAGYARLLLESATCQSEEEQSRVDRGGDLLESRTLFEYALRMYRQLHGDLHVTVGRALVGLGDVHIELEENEEALPYLDDALVILAEVCGPNSLDMAECHNRVGSVLQALKVYDEAKEAYKEAMRIFVRHHGQEHSSVAKVTNNFATLMDAMGERDEAMFFYDQALSMLKRIHGETHPQVLVTLDNLASLFADMGLVEESLEVEAQADAIAERMMSRSNSKKKQATAATRKRGRGGRDVAGADVDVAGNKGRSCVVM